MSERVRPYQELRNAPLSEWTDAELQNQLLQLTRPVDERKGARAAGSRRANFAKLAKRVGDEIRRRAAIGP